MHVVKIEKSTRVAPLPTTQALAKRHARTLRGSFTDEA
jgi:hypothetical protein